MDSRRLYVLLFSNPALIFCLTACIINRDYAWLLLSLCIYWASLDTIGLSGNLYSLVNGANTVKNIFTGKENQNLKEIDLEEVRPFLPEKLVESLYENTPFQRAIRWIREANGLHSDFKKIRIYVRSFTSPPIDYLVKSYVSFSGTSFIFVRDHVDQYSQPFQKFKFYHELAHVSLYGMMGLANINARILKYVILFLLFVLLVDMNSYCIIGIILIAAVEVGRRLIAPTEFEAKADALALFSIEKEDQPIVLRLCKKIWVDSEKSGSFENFYRWKNLNDAYNSIRKSGNNLPNQVYFNRFNRAISVFTHAIIVYIAFHTAEISVPKALAIGLSISLGILAISALLYGRVVIVEKTMEDFVAKLSKRPKL